ncbi:hypothetical protein BDF14DRAFT_1823389 [Spinellus fusiger]|nr:hypothetical protein BDF14DRAFT_1823389 [Spinellus fusiger]
MSTPTRKRGHAKPLSPLSTVVWTGTVVVGLCAVCYVDCLLFQVFSWVYPGKQEPILTVYWTIHACAHSVLISRQVLLILFLLIYLSIYLSVYLSVCLSIYLSILSIQEKGCLSFSLIRAQTPFTSI